MKQSIVSRAVAPMVGAVIFSLAHVLAAPPSTVVLPIQPIPFPTPISLGVTTSLTTSGYNFTTGYIFPPPAKPGQAQPDYVIFGPTMFTASFALTNHTFSPIDFTVPVSATPVASAVNAVPLVVFSVYDDNNNLVWSSWTNPGNLGSGSAVLQAGGVWKLTAQIPLKVNNVTLTGSYTLVASVNGTPEFSATAAFKVFASPIVDPPGPLPATARGKGAK